MKRNYIAIAQISLRQPPLAHSVGREIPTALTDVTAPNRSGEPAAWVASPGELQRIGLQKGLFRRSSGTHRAAHRTADGQERPHHRRRR